MLVLQTGYWWFECESIICCTRLLQGLKKHKYIDRGVFSGPPFVRFVFKVVVISVGCADQFGPSSRGEVDKCVIYVYKIIVEIDGGCRQQISDCRSIKSVAVRLV